MKEQHTFYLPSVAEKGQLSDDDARHAVRTLRMTAGDELLLLNGQGEMCTAVIDEATQKRCTFHTISRQRQTKAWQGHIHLAIAPTKHIDRTEWLVEKATELGFDELTFLRTQFSERTTLRLDRIERIVIAAMKQSRNAFKPLLHDMTPFKEFVRQQTLVADKKNDQRAVFLAHCYTDRPRTDMYEWLKGNANTRQLTLMIGPEGDFSIDETNFALQQGITPVTLGESRLRTETAGLAGVMMMNLHNRRT